MFVVLQTKIEKLKERQRVGDIYFFNQQIMKIFEWKKDLSKTKLDKSVVYITNQC